MTAEDPVEYNMYGVNQVLVRNEVGLTSLQAEGVSCDRTRTFIMIGEIRDLETGGYRHQGRAHGHLVLSTLHTNSAPER